MMFPYSIPVCPMMVKYRYVLFDDAIQSNALTIDATSVTFFDCVAVSTVLICSVQCCVVLR